MNKRQTLKHLRRRLSLFTGHYDEEGNWERADELNRCINLLQNCDEWIPISNPPKESGKYLVTLEGDEETYVLHYDKDEKTWEDDAYEDWYYKMVYRVVAWQPFPEPYRGE